MTSERIRIPLAAAVSLLIAATIYFTLGPIVGLAPNKVAVAADALCAKAAGCIGASVTPRSTPERTGVANQVILDFNEPPRAATVEAIRSELLHWTPVKSQRYLTVQARVNGELIVPVEPARGAKTQRKEGK